MVAGDYAVMTHADECSRLKSSGHQATNTEGSHNQEGVTSWEKLLIITILNFYCALIAKIKLQQSLLSPAQTSVQMDSPGKHWTGMKQLCCLRTGIQLRFDFLMTVNLLSVPNLSSLFPSGHMVCFHPSFFSGIHNIRFLPVSDITTAYWQGLYDTIEWVIRGSRYDYNTIHCNTM